MSRENLSNTDAIKKLKELSEKAKLELNSLTWSHTAGKIRNIYEQLYCGDRKMN